MVFFSRSLLAVAALVGLWASSAPARAQNPNVSLSEINVALKNIPPQSGRFEQSLPNGNMARGTYHMQWPARLRFAYEGANDGGSIVTVKGKFVAVQEKLGAEPNWFPVSLTPLSVLRQAVRDGITQDMVRARDDSDSVIALTLHDPKGELPGEVTLYFTRAELTLYAWRLVDVQNLVTQVRLSQIIPTDRLDASVFIIDYDEPDEE
ncbi:MAG: outer membrane lipoprotein carrier protein LolA [Alphaproteobacteria bacterium]|nr:outer membrane lipoprotein carrier protein LolA [Alphaproteobacteria bacterium]